MTLYTMDDLEHADTNHAVQIADRIWWVGHRQDDDVFQCHVYLIEQGRQSVLLDPGSVLTFRHTLRKIEEIVPFSHIRYFVCHHADPDITGAMPLIDQMIGRDDAALVTHSRTQMLIKHHGLRLPFWLVDTHDWKLVLEDRGLDFVFTPYAHFPGAICTFDPVSQVLFSSDLFGGLTPEFALVAQDERYFEILRPFHEHYMPSRDILGHALQAIERHPVRVIAPQHGSIIPEHLAGFMINKLKTLECGLYLIARGDTNIQRLSHLNQTLRDITQTMLIYRDFGDIATSLLGIVRRVLPVKSLEFYARLDGQRALHLAPESRYRGVEVELPATLARVLDLNYVQWRELDVANMAEFLRANPSTSVSPFPLPLPLFSPHQGTTQAIAILHLTDPVAPSDELQQILEQISTPLQVAVEREAIHRQLDLERQRTYEQLIRDPLTGLFTRVYMQEAVQRWCDLQDRDSGNRVAVLMLDIDHFKRVNDTYGHNQGDAVLRQVAAEILGSIRGSDIPVRLGGEEFVVFLVSETITNVILFAERLRARVAAIRFEAPMNSQSVTVSVGVAIRQARETLLELIQRADGALYDAKNGGRDQVRIATEFAMPPRVA